MKWLPSEYDLSIRGASIYVPLKRLRSALEKSAMIQLTSLSTPQNAVLLVCPNSQKGCMPYVCDTSARHSNCLDTYKRTAMEEVEGKEGELRLPCPLCRGSVTGQKVNKGKLLGFLCPLWSAYRNVTNLVCKHMGLSNQECPVPDKGF
jgi:hypothetical protein